VLVRQLSCEVMYSRAFCENPTFQVLFFFKCKSYVVAYIICLYGSLCDLTLEQKCRSLDASQPYEPALSVTVITLQIYESVSISETISSGIIRTLLTESCISRAPAIWSPS
jgi:hypothetical protein